MNLIKSTGLIGSLCITFILLFPLPGLTESWWQSKQERKASDDIQVASVGVAGRVSSASRANWEDGYIEVMAGATADMRDAINLAHAYSLAMKTARHLAYERMAETVTGLNLYSNATYDRELMIDSNLKTVVSAMIRNARVVDERKSQFSDGSIWVEVVLGMKLFGEDGLIKPSVEWNRRRKTTIKPAPEPKPVVSDTQVPSVADTGQVYTGLIIDAGGLGASPAMLPKVLSEGGEVIYGTRKIDKQYVLKLGLMGYQNNLAKARRLPRVGKNPLIVQAKRVSGKNKTDFVLSRMDTELIKMAVARKDFLNECRVVALID